MKAVLHPISAQWEEGYSTPTQGSLLVAVEDPSQEDVWTGATGLYISQVMPDGSRRARFGGEILTSNGVGGGAFALGIQSIDGFLNDRVLAGPSEPYGLEAFFGSGPQTGFLTFNIYKPVSSILNVQVFSFFGPGGLSKVASLLVNAARGNIEGEGFTGISTLTSVVDAPDAIYPPTGSWDQDWWNFKNIGQFIREIVESEAGPKYSLEHTFTNGFWSSVMRFSDVIGTARDYNIRSDIEAKEYGLSVDASEKATRVYGIGQGDEALTMFSIAYDADTTDNLPERHATVAWKDTTNPTTLDAQTVGYVADHRDPVTVPSATLYGLPDYDPEAAGYDPQKGFPGPEILKPGDTFGVDIGYGAITVQDIQVRCLAVSWELSSGAPAKRTIAMQPVERANESIRTQTPARVVSPIEPIPVAPPVPIQAQSIPWPAPGLVSRVQSADLAEISGMQYSKANPGYIWVVEDEKETPDQVSIVNRSTGARTGYFNITGVSTGNVGDPEAIRLARSTNKLVIADTGDNDLNRPTSGAGQPSLLVVTEPKGTGVKGTLPTTRYPVAYPGGARMNVETLLIHPTTEQVYLVSKEASQARVFSYGALSSMSTTNNVGTLVATITNSNQISDGTHTFAGDFILFRSASTSKTQVYSPSWKRVGQLPTPAMVKSEAITVESACAFLTTTEGSNAPIYRVLIPTKFGATCNTVTGPEGTGTGGQTGPNGPKVVPGQVLNLNAWKLQLPIN